MSELIKVGLSDCTVIINSTINWMCSLFLSVHLKNLWSDSIKCGGQTLCQKHLIRFWSWFSYTNSNIGLLTFSHSFWNRYKIERVITKQGRGQNWSNIKCSHKICLLAVVVFLSRWWNCWLISSMMVLGLFNYGYAFQDQESLICYFTSAGKVELRLRWLCCDRSPLRRLVIQFWTVKVHNDKSDTEFLLLLFIHFYCVESSCCYPGCCSSVANAIIPLGKSVDQSETMFLICSPIRGCVSD